MGLVSFQLSRKVRVEPLLKPFGPFSVVILDRGLGHVVLTFWGIRLTALGGQLASRRWKDWPLITELTMFNPNHHGPCRTTPILMK